MSESVKFVALSVLAIFVYNEFLRTNKLLRAGSLTPNALGLPASQPMPSVSSGSSVLTQQQTGTNLFAGSGLGNNPVPPPVAGDD